MEKTEPIFTATDIKKETDRLYHDLDVCKITCVQWSQVTGSEQSPANTPWEIQILSVVDLYVLIKAALDRK